jgi:2-(1,2-epoxy-1,2-dihydrophenyl)acetyl-CoA isomerase
MSYETVKWEQDGGVGRITLDRPETMNAWIGQFGHELGELINERAADPSVRAVLITGAGRGFSSGADLKAGFEPHPEDNMPNVHKGLTENYHHVIVGIRTLPKPVVAAVNGAAVGIGCSLALACDLIWAAESAVFGLAFVNIGLVPDGGSTFLVPVAAGKARALEMALLGDPIPAERALEWGLINRVVPDAGLMAEARDLASRLAQGPTRSYAQSKRALNNSLLKIMDEQLDLEADIQAEMVTSSDFIEGVTAFVQKRDPRFTGN